MEILIGVYPSKVEELLALPSASAPLAPKHEQLQAHTCMCTNTCTLSHAHTCASVSLTDEKEESILGSIPLLSFRVAAVQPSDNISRKHTFKVSWTSPSG